VDKIKVIALREYLAAVRAKTFLVTILLMPVLMGASVAVQVLFRKLEEGKEKKFAVIDHTAEGKLFTVLEMVAKTVKEEREKNPTNADLASFKIDFVSFPPRASSGEQLAEQRYEISQKIEKGELEGLIEIGADVFAVPPDDLLETGPGGRRPNVDKISDQAAVRYQAKNVGALQLRGQLAALLNEAVRLDRLVRSGVSAKEIKDAQIPLAIKTKSLTRQEADGKFSDAPDETRIVNLVLPGVLIGLMFMIVMVGATPAMHGIVEEKGLRISEVLLGSVTPFQLMAGKLLGIVGVALTMAVVYLGGGYFIAWYYGFAELLPPALMAWFVPMTILALLIFGSLFIAVGAAASDIKDTQSLLMPIMIFACMPFFALGPIMMDPHGPIARVCTFFPFATPMLLVARQSVSPENIPWWETTAAIVLVLATTLLCVWAAGRIFRVGILLQGKTPSFTDLVRWVAKG